MVNWFPLLRSLMESQDFVALPSTEKLYYLLLVSEFARRGQFYRPDLEFGVTLGLSVPKIRKARRRFVQWEWIKIREGFRSGGRDLATTYLSVRWAKTPETGDEEWWVPMHRFAFEVMLARIRRRKLSHDDVVVYVVLCYLRHRYGGNKNDQFFVTKDQLRALTGIYTAPARVQKLYEQVQFDGGNHLFEFCDAYHRLEFTAWSMFLDPGEKGGEQNRQNAAIWAEEIRQKVAQARAKTKAKQAQNSLRRAQCA